MRENNYHVFAGDDPADAKVEEYREYMRAFEHEDVLDEDYTYITNYRQDCIYGDQRFHRSGIQVAEWSIDTKRYA